MSYHAAQQSFAEEIADIKSAGLWKTERVIASDQKNDITLCRWRPCREHVCQQLFRARQSSQSKAGGQ